MSKEVTKEDDKFVQELILGIRPASDNHSYDEIKNRFSAVRENSSIPTVQSEPSEQIESTEQSLPIQPIESNRRTSTKQRKASLNEYREAFMVAPKITDRQPVFVSRSTRDRIDEIVRRFGERKMSVSGFLENLTLHHLEIYSEDLEQWKRL